MVEETTNTSEDPTNNDDDPEVVIKKKKSKKIEIKVDRDPEIDALQKELAEQNAKYEAEKKKWEEEREKTVGEKQVLEEELGEKKAVIEKAAMEAFEKKKLSILEICKTSGLSEEQIEEIQGKLTSPKEIDTVESLVNILSTQAQALTDKTGEGDEGATPQSDKKPPAGKPVFTPPKGAKEYEDVRSMVDGLYETAYYNPDATMEEKKEAQKKIDQLWQSFIGGKSWSSLREGKRFPTGQVTQCPKCGEVFVGTPPEKCPKCKHKLDILKEGDSD